MNRIVCDAGPIIHLHEADQLELLSTMGEVVVPIQVKAEVEAFVNFRVWPTYLKVHDILGQRHREVTMLCKTGDLQAGEAHAIILARDLSAEWLLTDDLAARVFARSIGLEVHGSLGVILWNVAHGSLSAKMGERALRKLSKTSLWVSARILDEALEAMKEFSG